VTLLKNIKLI